MFPRRTHPSASNRLTSTKNPLLREIRKAVQRGSLTSDGLCVAEGFHLLEEARRSPCEVEVVIASDSAAPRVEGECITVPDDVFEAVASTQTTQGVIALVRPREYQVEDTMQGVALVLVLDGVQDPGNAGTLIRAAEAFGATGVLMTRGCVSPWNPKTLRASAGSAFRVPLVQAVTPDMLPAMRVFATVPQGTRLLDDADLRKPSAVVIGSEAHGVSADWLARAEGLTIRTSGVESLNAGIAGAIVLYEASRQRRRNV